MNTVMTVIGTRDTSFNFDDGRTCSGINFYVTYPLDKGTGLACERVFLTNEKLQKSGFIPAVGDAFVPTYNRYGKIDLITKSEPGAQK